MNTLWYIQTMEYDSAIKRSELVIQITTWMKLRGIAAASLQSCPTLCDPIDGSPTGSAIPGILQARILEWVAVPFSRGPS